MQHDPKDMLLFARVVELGSLSAASRITGKPKASVSRAITRLEDALGVRLLERGARRSAVTEAGRLFHAYCERIAQTMDDAQSAMDDWQGRVGGLLKVASSVTIGQALLTVLVPRFLGIHPDLRIQLEVTNRHVDLVEEGFDVAFKAGPLKDSALIARNLGKLTYGVFASPDVMSRLGPIRRPADLAQQKVVDNFTGRDSVLWRFIRGSRIDTVRVRATLDFNDALMRKEALIQGAGIGLVPEWICRDALATGQLVRVLPAWTCDRAVRVYAVWPRRHHPAPRLRALLDFVADEMPRLIGSIPMAGHEPSITGTDVRRAARRTRPIGT